MYIDILQEADIYIDATHLKTNSTWHISQLFYPKFKYQQKAINQNIQLFMKLYFFLIQQNIHKTKNDFLFES